jgi:hypothetical protein
MLAETVHLNIGSLVFENLDQIDLTGPFEVLSRIPNATHRIYSKSIQPVRDVMGLRITPDATLAEAPQLDILHMGVVPPPALVRRRPGGRTGRGRGELDLRRWRQGRNRRRPSARRRGAQRRRRPAHPARHRLCARTAFSERDAPHGASRNLGCGASRCGRADCAARSERASGGRQTRRRGVSPRDLIRRGRRGPLCASLYAVSLGASRTRS